MLSTRDLQLIGNLLDHRFDALDEKFNQINKRLDKLEKKMDLQEKKLDSVEKKLTDKIQVVQADTSNIILCLDKVIVTHDKRITRVETSLDLPPIVAD